MISDNGGIRTGIERRIFSYNLHVPERRSKKDRRGGLDRRDRKGFGLEHSKERRIMFNDNSIIKEYDRQKIN